MKNKYYILLLSLIITWNSFSTVYYIDATAGNDSNNGTSPATAWQTISKVINSSATFLAGDQILFKKGEAWNGQSLKILNHPSGTASAPIVYSSYGTGSKPIINLNIVHSPVWIDEGNDIWSTEIQTGARFFKNNIEMLRAYATSYLGLYGTTYNTSCIDGCNGLKLTIASGTDPVNDVYSWSNNTFVLGFVNANYIHIIDLDLQGGAGQTIRMENNHNWEIINCSIGKNAGNGITVENSSNILIQDCVLDANNTIDQSQLPADIPHSSYSGCGDGIFVTTGSSYINVNNCFFKNWGHASFSANTTDATQRITAISFYNNELTSPDILYGGRLGYSGYAENSEYYNNYIHNISVQNQLGGSNNHFHHNIIDGVLDSPLKSDPIGNGISISNYNIQVKNNIIENNTIANTQNNGLVIYSINFDFPGEVSGNIFRNNILYNCGTTINDIAIEYNHNQTDQATYNNLLINNLVYSSQSTQTCQYGYNGNVYDINTFNNQNADIQNNIAGDPLFVDASLENFHLSENSPAIDAGISPLSSLDYDGNTIPYGPACDIGAYEYYPSLYIENYQNTSSLLYPNPAKEIISFSKDFTNNKFIIFAINGQEIKAGIISNNQINISQLPVGFYNLKINNLVFKLCVQR